MIMAAKRAKKKDTFSATKAVKANARERVGSPPPSVPLDPEQKRRLREKKHKKTLSALLTGDQDAS
jgi:hypothetical protein